VRTNTSIGNNLSIDELSEYAAYFLGLGLQQSRTLDIEGEDAEGVMPGLEYLAAVNEGTEVAVGRKVIVIAAETRPGCARSALRWVLTSRCSTGDRKRDAGHSG